MDIHEVRQMLRYKTIYEIPLRVTYYARVSSDSDEQLNSLSNQVAYYEDLIRKNLPWTFIPGYIDEGLSGISTKKRENFNRMVDDAAEDKFDLVITKEISRFARNTLDSIQYTRELLNHGVGVFFQNDNINTLDEDSELRLSIMSSIAQDELRKLSSRVKFGHQQAIKKNVVLGNSRIFGFDHTEWATDGEKSIIVATLTNANGAHTKIALVDPADSSITEIAEGDELWHPTLWIKKKVKPILSSSSNLAISSSSAAPDSIEINSSSSIIPPEPEFGLDLDSAGAYYVAGGIENALIMRYKMELLWTYYDSANVVILGSSRSKNGIIPAMFNDSIKAINLAVSDFSINEAYYVYKNYIASNVKNLKYLIVSLDIDMWWKEYASTENFFYQEYKNYPGYIYDINHNFWKDNIPSDLQEATYDCLGAASKNFNRQTLGFSSFAANGWRDNPSIVYDSTWNQQNPELFNASLNYLDSIIHDAHDKNIYVIGVIFPQSPAYKNTGSYGAYGLTRSEAPALIDRIRLLSDSLPNFIVFDENKMGDHDYPDEMARDGDHLATPGAEQMTHRLDSLIQTLNIDFENSNQPSDF